MKKGNKEVNPFVVTTKRFKRRFVSTGSVVVERVDEETGEIIQEKKLTGEVQQVDVDNFIKLYEPKALLSMGGTTLRVFFYMLCRLQYKGIIPFDAKECATTLQLKSVSNIYKSIAELTNGGFIQKKDNNSFWINPNIAYRGVRQNLCTQYAPLPPTPDNLNTEQDE